MSGYVSATVAVLALVSSTTMGVMQMQAADEQARKQEDALRRSYAAASAENTRLEAENNRIADEQKSDVVRKAEGELGTIRVAAAELGMSDASLTGAYAQQGYAIGMDLSRLEKNRSSQEQALQAQKLAGAMGTQASVTATWNQASNSNTQAIGSMIGSALSIGGKVYDSYQTDSRQTALMDALKNRSSGGSGNSGSGSS